MRVYYSYNVINNFFWSKSVSASMNGHEAYEFALKKVSLSKKLFFSFDFGHFIDHIVV